MSRLLYNNALGLLGAPLTSGATTITFGSAPSFATLTGADYIPIVIEPPVGPAPSANFEIVHLTAYTAGQTTGTILRAQEGTSAVAHSNAVIWAHGPFAFDITNAGGGGGGIAGSWSSTTTDHALYVSKTGSDSTGDGTLGKPFLTIQAAVNAANALGVGRIEVGAGTYQAVSTAGATVRIDVKPLHIRGVGPTNWTAGTFIVAPSATADVIQVMGTKNAVDNTILENLTLQPFNSTWNGHYIREALANNVIKINCTAKNPNTATQTAGGIGLAVAHGEKSICHNFRTGNVRVAVRPGVESALFTMHEGSGAGNYAEFLDGFYDTLRAQLTADVTSSSSTFSIDNDGNLFQAAGMGIIDSEGIAWNASPASNQITGVQRAVVAFLISSITNSQTTGIKVAPLSQGPYAVQTASGAYLPNPFLTTIPASGSLILDPGTASSETVTYTGLTNNGDGTSTLSGVTRGGTAFAHSASAACQDAALTSAAAHTVASGATVIQAAGATANLAGALSGGGKIENYKSTANVTQVGSDNIIDVYGCGWIFENCELCEGANNTIRIRQSARSVQFKSTQFASETAITDDGAFTQYDAPSGGRGLTLTSLSLQCRVSSNWGLVNGGQLAVTDNGTGTRFDALALDASATPLRVNNASLRVDGRIPQYSVATDELDGVQALIPPTPLTDGDLWYIQGGVLHRLAVGSGSQVLGVSSGLPAWVAGGLSNPMTTAGDIITGGASGAPQRLGAGSNGNVLTISAGAPAWAAPSGGGASPSAQIFTANGTYTVPAGATMLEIDYVAGHGGGGGGGTNSAAAANAGGGGGGAGQASRSVVAVGTNTSLTITIGAGGTSGTGGVAGGNAGGNGGAGGTTTVVGNGSGINLTAAGGNGGNGGPASATTNANGGCYGLTSSTSGGTPTPIGTGGRSASVGGAALGQAAGGGAGGSNSGTTTGGAGGGAGSINGGGAIGGGSAASGANGGAGQAGGTGVLGGPGGAGGGAPSGGTGGAGGAGSSGYVVVKVVG